MNRDDLQRLSKDDLIDLVLKLQRPVKTSRNSSWPPSSDDKGGGGSALSKDERRKRSRPGGAKPGHKGHFRELAANPDEVIDHEPIHCACCLAQFGADAERALLGEYDEIEIPVLKPHVRRHRRFALRCTHCAARTEADLPPEAQGTPFGSRIHALAIYLKTRHAFSYQRLIQAFDNLFGLAISEGAVMNMFKRAGAAFEMKREQALAILRKAKVVASDETGMRVEGVNAYQWVFCSQQAVVHVNDFTRSGAVIRETMNGHQPDVWLSDRYSAQQGHGARHQTCLAHLARDVKYALEASDDQIPLRLKLWLDRTFALSREIGTLAQSTLRAKLRQLRRDMDAIVRTPTTCSCAQDIRARFARAKDQLLTFAAYPGEVEPTNNQSERELRPAVIQRKVTNGYRAEWAANFEANVRTATSTMRLQGEAPFQAIFQTISP